VHSMPPHNSSGGSCVAFSGVFVIGVAALHARIGKTRRAQRAACSPRQARYRIRRLHRSRSQKAMPVCMHMRDSRLLLNPL